MSATPQVKLEPRIEGKQKSVEAPARRWTRIFDDMAEAMALLFEDAWEVIAVEHCLAPDREPRILIATNSGREVTLSMAVDRKAPVLFNLAGKSFTASSSFAEAHDRPSTLNRRKAANQSILRLVQGLHKAGPQYGLGWSNVQEMIVLLLKAKTDKSIVEFVHQPNLRACLHAEMCILNHIMTNGYIGYSKGEPQYIGVSKPCCAVCSMFIQACNDIATPKLGHPLLAVNDHHGELYERWEVPPFVYGPKYKKLLARFKEIVGVQLAKIPHSFKAHKGGASESLRIGAKQKAPGLVRARSPVRRSEVASSLTDIPEVVRLD